MANLQTVKAKIFQKRLDSLLKKIVSGPLGKLEIVFFLDRISRLLIREHIILTEDELVESLKRVLKNTFRSNKRSGLFFIEPVVNVRSKGSERILDVGIISGLEPKK
jgi:hypothetical protein